MASLNQTIQDVFNEPGCGKNQAKSEKERKKGCTKQLQPGGAAGGCAFDGAKIALQPITDVAHLVHGPIACEGNSWDNRGAASSGPQLYRTGFTTDMTKNDIVDLIFTGTAALSRTLHGWLAETESGRIRWYAANMAAGVVVLLLFVLGVL